VAVTPPTPEQEAALATAASGSSTVIDAGAGAGKTTLMVEAVWRDLEHDRVPLDRIFVAAYNRAAAAHLVARLQRRFADAEDGRGSGRVGLDLSGAWVGTLHSLAGRIVREHPFAAGVDPDFGELDEVESAALMEEALDLALAGAMRDPAFLDLAANARSLYSLRDATRHVHERLRAAGQERPSIAVPDATGPDPGRVAALRKLVAEVAAHPDARDRHHEVLTGACEMLLSGEPGPEAPRLSLTCTKALRPLCEKFNELAAEVFQAHLDVEAREQLRAFARHLELFAGEYARLKAERGALDYEDLLLAAHRVLRGGHPYAFARVYVDEYQDANALQSGIVDLLGAERTVVVGDGCQAIYGFRHADSSHFARRAGARARLEDNHRSQAPLLRALNGLLGAALAGEPSFNALRPAASADRPGPALADAPVELVDVRAVNPDPNAKAPLTTREQEAEAVADEVEALRERGFASGDIAVLFRAMTQVEPYRAAIAARGIPVHLVAGRGFFSHDQVADTMALLAVVENPLDEEALVRVLASPYASLSDSELVELRRAAGPSSSDWPAKGALWPAARRVPAAQPLVEAVDALRPLLRERGLAGLVEAAISACGYDLAVLGLPDGPRRYANLRRLVRMAEGHAAVRGPDLRGFLALLRTMADAGNQDPGEAVLIDPDLDAVRLATVHGVKGQEFPAVIIADASHAAAAFAPMVVVARDGRAGIRIPRIGASGAQALGYRDLLDGAKRAEAAEERRITYVAATRAERHLSVVGRSDARGSVEHGPFAVLAEALGLSEPGVAELPDDARAALRVVAADPVAAPESRPRLEPFPAAPAEAPTPAPAPAVDPLAGRRLSFSALSTLETCPLRFHLEYERGLRGREDAVVRPTSAPAGAASVWGGTAFGDLLHGFLAHHRWDGPVPAPGWAAAAADSVGLPASEADAARAEQLVAALLESDVAGRLRAGTALMVEQPFALAIDGVLLSGAIDLLADEGEGRAYLADWKTHALGTERTPADVFGEYRLQQALYGLAALRAGWREVTLHWVILQDIAGSPLRVVTAADAPALEAEVREALAALRDTGRPAAAETAQPFCSGCPGLDAMCAIASAATRGAGTLDGATGPGDQPQAN
jgi:ATP-dependent helicase/nuclease subunit A